MEKGWQVNMMGDIYHRATNVIIWLRNSIPHEIQTVRSMVRRAAQLVHQVQSEVEEDDERKTHIGHWQSLSEQDYSQRIEALGLPPCHSPQWLDFWRFFRRYWFQRVWGK